MSREWQNICPICGNYKQGGTCWRCNANASTRAKRWRRGDRGGVRPERRKFYKSKKDKKDKTPASAPVPATMSSKRRPRKRRIKKTYRPRDKFFLALQGEWYSNLKKLKVNIDLAKNRWVFTFSTGNRLTQVWRPKYSSSNKLIFTRRGKEITACVGNGGYLIMTGKSGPVPFVNVKSGRWYRLCRNCHNKSEWRYKKCKRCRHAF